MFAFDDHFNILINNLIIILSSICFWENESFKTQKEFSVTTIKLLNKKKIKINCNWNVQ